GGGGGLLEEGGGRRGSRSGAVLNLGGERGLAQRLPCHGGDALDVSTVTGRKAGASRAPSRVPCSERLGGPVRLPAECLCTGQAGEGLGHGLRVPQVLSGGWGPALARAAGL